MEGMNDEPQGDKGDEPMAASDGKCLIEDAVHGAGLGSTRGCRGVIIEPLLMAFILLNYLLAVLIPEYVLQQELQRLTGNDNITTHKTGCASHSNNTVDDDPYTRNLSDNPYTRNLSLASSAASYFELERTLVVTLPAIPMIMFLGAFGDKAGRKYAILPPIIGQLLAVLSCAVTVYFSLPVEVILGGFLAYGLCGQWTTFYSGCFAYIADITTKVISTIFNH